MSGFKYSAVCNQCGAEFVLEVSLLSSIREGDLEVHYFSCPACGEKYLFFASDSRMRALIGRRKAAQEKLVAARAKRLPKCAFKAYMREFESIKLEQMKLFPGLRALGEKLLHKTGTDDISEPVEK